MDNSNLTLDVGTDSTTMSGIGQSVISSSTITRNNIVFLVDGSVLDIISDSGVEFSIGGNSLVDILGFIIGEVVEVWIKSGDTSSFGVTE